MFEYIEILKFKNKKMKSKKKGVQRDFWEKFIILFEYFDFVFFEIQLIQNIQK